MRFELTTPTLARLCSTPELRPRSVGGGLIEGEAGRLQPPTGDSAYEKGLTRCRARPFAGNAARSYGPNTKSEASSTAEATPVSVMVEPSGRVIRALPPLAVIVRSEKSSTPTMPSNWNRSEPST